MWRRCAKRLPVIVNYNFVFNALDHPVNPKRPLVTTGSGLSVDDEILKFFFGYEEGKVYDVPADGNQGERGRRGVEVHFEVSTWHLAAAERAYVSSSQGRTLSMDDHLRALYQDGLLGAALES